jgi:hypothetical protein
LCEFGEDGLGVIVERDLVILAQRRACRRHAARGIRSSNRHAFDQAHQLLERLVGAAGDGVGALAPEGVLDDQ